MTSAAVGSSPCISTRKCRRVARHSLSTVVPWMAKVLEVPTSSAAMHRSPATSSACRSPAPGDPEATLRPSPERPTSSPELAECGCIAILGESSRKEGWRMDCGERSNPEERRPSRPLPSRIGGSSRAGSGCCVAPQTSRCRGGPNGVPRNERPLGEACTRSGSRTGERLCRPECSGFQPGGRTTAEKQLQWKTSNRPGILYHAGILFSYRFAT